MLAMTSGAWTLGWCSWPTPRPSTASRSKTWMCMMRAPTPALCRQTITPRHRVSISSCKCPRKSPRSLLTSPSMKAATSASPA
ncbi:protein CEPU-1 [Columba livia]|uniref:Protein CEPU-1 n=1 Tax=Columba livia TaxID=8932 RepID=A0A2I0LVE1_COLLI|nr:protein CEPU-1 [Columba livia]